ncbi:hypothetical protein AB4Y38_40270, partial [Paraburkholderia sp. EG285A]|uniref:hypothetical protein n=1 Tax=Paraburkholderia sp. EG285A TaxID=3237009 RepID=UPI0034D16239
MADGDPRIQGHCWPTVIHQYCGTLAPAAPSSGKESRREIKQSISLQQTVQAIRKMNSSFRLEPMTMPTSRRLLICAIPLLTALFSVLVTTMVFSREVPGLTKEFPSASTIDAHKDQASPTRPE